MDASIARERLANQRLDGTPLPTAVDAVEWLVASQAQDFASAKWALGLRTHDATDAAIDDAYDTGTILRTHVLRPTWHFVSGDDIRWLLSLTAPRVHKANAHQYRLQGLDGPTLSKTASVIARALEQQSHLTREELQTALSRARIDAEGLRLAYIVMHAELEAIICSGPRRGKQLTYALLEERAPRAIARSRDEALTELARRYFESRGPATAQDLAKWSGLTLTEARNGLEAVATALRADEVDGTTYWSAASRPGDSAPVAHLLSIYDEYISSYRDRSAIGTPEDGRLLAAMGNALTHVAIFDGRIVGTWKRSVEKRTVSVNVTPFRKLAKVAERAVTSAAERFCTFLGGERDLELIVDQR